MKLLNILKESILSKEYKFIVRVRYNNTTPTEVTDVLRALSGVVSAKMLKSERDNEVKLHVTILTNKNPDEAINSMALRAKSKHRQIVKVLLVPGTLIKK